MLCLTRKLHEEILIGDNINIVVTGIHTNYVKIGIVAPREYPVHRREVYERIKSSSPQNIINNTALKCIRDIYNISHYDQNISSNSFTFDYDRNLSITFKMYDRPVSAIDDSIDWHSVQIVGNDIQTDKIYIPFSGPHSESMSDEEFITAVQEAVYKLCEKLNK